MKKVLCVLAFLVLPVVAFADDQREILLTSDGTLFVAEQVSNDFNEIDSSVMAYIQLTARRGEETKRFIVPGTLEAGLHKNPALAYDDVSKTLFVFWQRTASLLHSELLFQTMTADFQWGPAAAFGDGWNMRENLRIAVTRRADEPAADGQSTITVPQVNVHAVWWETDSWDGQESAQYAMLTVEKGAVIQTSIHQLFAYVDPTASDTRFVADSVPEVLKHPALFPSPQQDSVLVLFGEIRDRSFNRVRIRPAKIAADARVHIPVGRTEGRGAAPRFDSASNSERVGTLIGGDDRVALYTSTANKLHYILFKDGKWSEDLAVPIDGSISRDAAINAVRRLIEHE
jgi:hypothetical protein